MTFLGPGFAALLAVALLAHRLAPPRRRPLVLLAFSLGFYLLADPVHLPVLLALTLATHLAARHADRPAGGGRPAVVAAGVIGLLAVLAASKLAADALAAWRPAPEGPPVQPLMLLLAPVGLSYYVFKLVGYLLDVHWGRLPAERSPLRLALYASFAPQILSGPIQRAGDFLGQLDRAAPPGREAVAQALRRILLGLVKKFAVADRLAPAVALAHADPERLGAPALLLGAYAFALQLYADFSGLTDVAIGLGLLFGVRGPENFDLPFFAPSLPEYWRRWHMSLTSWLGDYLFTPLRLSLRRLGRAGLALALIVNMVAIGLWHGAAWTYAAFGALHGVLLAASALTARWRGRVAARAAARAPALARLRPVLGALVTFHLVVLALIVFRAPSLAGALAYLEGLLPGGRAAQAAPPALAALGLSPAMLGAILLVAGGVEAVQALARRPAWRARFLDAPWPLRWGLYYAGAGLAFFFGGVAAQQFIYAQF